MRQMLVRAFLLALVLVAAPPPSSVEVETIPEVVDATLDVVVPASVQPASDGAVRRDARRSEVQRAPLRFSMIGFELPDGVDSVRVRTAGDDGEFDDWYDLQRSDPEDGPDPGTAEAANDRSDRHTEPLWVGDATRFQIELPEVADGRVRAAEARPEELRATVIDALGLSGQGDEHRRVRVSGPTAEAAAAQPRIVSRAGWGANESWRKGSPSYSSSVNMAVVHHTAHAAPNVANSYSRSDAPALVRSFYRYHTQTMGWSDIGYNFLVDRFGTVYEGRAGGINRGVVGAHAGGYNTASFGVAVIGNFAENTNYDASSAAYESLANVIAWKSGLHGIDPLGTTSRTYNGRALRTISGHRDMGTTSCPGNIKDRLWWIRLAVEERLDVPRFPDVGEPHRDNVLTLADHKIINGYPDNTFRPANTLTRGQMATVVAQALGLGSVQPDGRFKDVDITTSHAGHIHAVAARGIVGGYPDGTFRPDRPVRRDQMATFLAKALGLSDRIPTFLDVPLNNPHRGSIGAIQHAGVATGDGSRRYNPDARLRRAQAASLVAKAFEIS